MIKIDENSIRKYFGIRLFFGSISWPVVFLINLFFATNEKNLQIAVFLLFTLIVFVFFVSLIEWKVDRIFKDVESKLYEYIEKNTYLFLLFFVYVGFDYIFANVSHNFYFSIILLNLIFIIVIFILYFNPFLIFWIRKSKPLSDEKILSKAIEIGDRLGVKIEKLYVYDSDRMRVANAFQTGMKSYYIFVTSYLIKMLSYDEIIAVVAHEIIHAGKKHVRNLSLLSISTTFVSMNLLVISISNHSLIGIIISFALSFSVFFGLTPYIQRHFEREADIEGSRLTSPRDLSEALRKLSRINLIPMSYSSLLNMNHPSFEERIDYLSKLERK